MNESDIRRMAGYVSMLNPAMGEAIARHASELAAAAEALGVFRAYGDDYGGVELVCSRCTEPNLPYGNRRLKRIGYVDPEGDHSVADLVKLCAEHEHE